MTALNPTLARVTDRIVARSQASRAQYLQSVAAQRKAGPQRAGMGCANRAHTTAALPAADKLVIHAERAPHVGVITAYNDMLSAHQPYEHYPELLRGHARAIGATAQVAGGVPAMCDGVTQGRTGMELSLFSRDVIAMSAGVALTHDAFDAARSAISVDAMDQSRPEMKVPPCLRISWGNRLAATMLTKAGVMSSATPRSDNTTKTGDTSSTSISGASQSSTLDTPQASSHVKTLDKREEPSSNRVIAATALSQ